MHPQTDAPAPAGVTPTGPQALPEGQRYRGYAPAGGASTAENNTENVVNRYYWSADGMAKNTSGYLQGTKVAEEITWSQVRHDAYACLAIDVKPAASGKPTTFTIRTLADALPGTDEACSVIGRITLRRSAGPGL